jgi:hypothetical protein
MGTNYEAYAAIEQEKQERAKNQLMKTTMAPPSMIAELEAELARFRKAAQENATLFEETMRFKKGEWLDGAGKEVANGLQWIAVMNQAEHGWRKWEVVGEDENGNPKKRPVYTVGLVNSNWVRPMRKELGDMDRSQWETYNNQPDDPWKLVGRLPLVAYPKVNRFITFVTDTPTGTSRFWKLIDEYGKQARLHSGLYPVVEIPRRRL